MKNNGYKSIKQKNFRFPVFKGYTNVTLRINGVISQIMSMLLKFETFVLLVYVVRLVKTIFFNDYNFMSLSWDIANL